MSLHQSGVVHVCVGCVFCVTSIHVGGHYTSDQEKSHVIVTCLSGDLKLLSAISLFTDGQQNSHLYLQTVSAINGMLTI